MGVLIGSCLSSSRRVVRADEHARCAGAAGTEDIKQSPYIVFDVHLFTVRQADAVHCIPILLISVAL